MVRVIGILLSVFAWLGLAHGETSDLELRRALSVLARRFEVHPVDTSNGLIRIGGFVGAVGSIALAASIFGVSVVDGWAVTDHDYFLGIGIIVTGLGITAAGHARPWFVTRDIGDDTAWYREPGNIKYFVTLPIERQYWLASGDSELRRLVIHLAEALDSETAGVPVRMAVPSR